jgi:hypothetical protein
LGIPKRSCKVLQVKRFKVLDLNKKRKLHAEVAKIDGKNKSICEIAKKEKKFVLVLLSYLRWP